MEHDEEEDISVSPLHEAVEARDTRFKPGQSGNPKGRPKGSGKAKSRMRTTLKELYGIQGDAIEILRISMTGFDSNGRPAEAPKDKVDMAKFVVKAIESINNSCLREEGMIINIRDKGNDDGANELESNQVAPADVSGAFSMDMPDEEDRGK